MWSGALWTTGGLPEHLGESYSGSCSVDPSPNCKPMTWSGKVQYFRLLMLLALSAMALITWGFASKPVLPHTHILTKDDRQECGAYNQEGTGVTILNPFRSRAPERIADRFLRAASNADCSPDLNEEFCKFVRKRPLPAKGWRLVYRRDFPNDVRLYFRLRGQWQQPGADPCWIAEVHLRRFGATWRTFGLAL